MIKVMFAALMVVIAGAQAVQPKWVRERLALEKACGEGDAAACTRAGELHASGQGGSSSVREPNPGAALPFYERGCAAGHMPGCESLARLLLTGDGVPKNVSRAIDLFSKACGANDPFACLALGGVYERGDGAPRDPMRTSAFYARAVEILTASCQGGNARHCTNLGSHVFEGRFGVTKDVARGLALQEQGCELGDDSGCLAAGNIYVGNTPGGPRNPERATRLFDRARALDMAACDAGDFRACASIPTMEGEYKGCEAGDPDACFQLGNRYIPYRDDEPGNVERAAHFFLKGCDNGTPSLCTEVADMYAGVSERSRRQLLAPDLPKAAGLYSRACDAGDSEACRKLAAMTAEGRGAARDPARAAKLYDDGCAGGDPSACVALGKLHQRGEGVPRSAARAAELYDRACKLQHLEGCFELGLLHRDGAGVARDAVLARKLFHDVCATNPYYDSSPLIGCREACDLGDGSACAALGRAAERGSALPQLEPRSAAALYERAVRLYEAECEAGAAQSCYELGALYKTDRPIRKDTRLLVRWLDRGCTLGSARACHDLARVYDWGTDVFVQDHARAVTLYLKACTLEHVEACERAGRMVLNGDGLPASERQGRDLLQRADELKRKRGF